MYRTLNCLDHLHHSNQSVKKFFYTRYFGGKKKERTILRKGNSIQNNKQARIILKVINQQRSISNNSHTSPLDFKKKAKILNTQSPGELNCKNIRANLKKIENKAWDIRCMSWKNGNEKVKKETESSNF